MGSSQYVNKSVNIWCAENAASICIYWHLVNLTPTTINADEYLKNVNKNRGFLCIRMYLFVLYYALLSQMFEHLLLNNMDCYRCYNVS